MKRKQAKQNGPDSTSYVVYAADILCAVEDATREKDSTNDASVREVKHSTQRSQAATSILALKAHVHAADLIDLGSDAAVVLDTESRAATFMEIDAGEQGIEEVQVSTKTNTVDLSPLGPGHRLVAVLDGEEGYAKTKRGHIAGAIQMKTKVETIVLSAVPAGHEFAVRVSARNEVGWAKWGVPLHFRLVVRGCVNILSVCLDTDFELIPRLSFD